MSHFCTYVILPLTAAHADTAEVEHLIAELLEPYREERRVAPYEIHLTDEELARMARAYHTTPDNLADLAARIPDWCGGEQGRVEDGTVVYVSDRNPMPRWDWYTVGGRWSGSMQMTAAEQAESKRLSATVGYEAALRFEEALDLEHRSNLCAFSSIANPDPPFALVTPEGQWYEKARMGWFGATDMRPSPRLVTAQEAWADATARQVGAAELEAVRSEWQAAYQEVEDACQAEWASAYAQIVRPYVAADHLVACVDCHI